MNASIYLFGGTWGVILEPFKFIGYIFDNFEWDLKLYPFFLFSVYSFINSWDHPLYMFYVKFFPNSVSRMIALRNGKALSSLNMLLHVTEIPQ